MTTFTEIEQAANSYLKWLRTSLLEDLDKLDKTQPELAKHARLGLERIECLQCMGTGRFIIDRDQGGWSIFSPWDGNGDYNIITCPACNQGRKDWIAYARDKNIQHNGRKVLSSTDSHARVYINELARIYVSFFKDIPVPQIHVNNKVHVEGAQIHIENNNNNN